MLRLVVCFLLVAAAVIPVEQPAAHAEKWTDIPDTGICVDADSEVDDQNGVFTWSQDYCLKNATYPGFDAHMRVTVRCSEQDFRSSTWRAHVYYIDQDSSADQTFQADSPEGKVIGYQIGDGMACD